ncbi:hypothetical protein VNO77_22022 [Canavalia gladiata]|uniref:Uncharacterized protein n=1 Tax=Canavalia gladiata TaxID=3824 RepID=A0AAN9L2A7_CANGL
MRYTLLPILKQYRQRLVLAHINLKDKSGYDSQITEFFQPAKCLVKLSRRQGHGHGSTLAGSLAQQQIDKCSSFKILTRLILNRNLNTASSRL